MQVNGRHKEKNENISSVSQSLQKNEESTWAFTVSAAVVKRGLGTSLKVTLGFTPGY